MDEIFITIIVIIVMVMHLSSSILITSLLPMTVLMVFIGMKLFGVDANIVALSGIAIAIGTIVDMGIVVSENMLKHLQEAGEEDDKTEVLFRAVSEVGGAVLTAVSTTVVSFLPVFAMEAAEGKLFKPLAHTKTIALISSVILALTVLPPLAHILYTKRLKSKRLVDVVYASFALFGIYVLFAVKWWLGLVILLFGIFYFVKHYLHPRIQKQIPHIVNWIVVLIVAAVLSTTWEPLGAGRSGFINFLFVVLLISAVMGVLLLFTRSYPRMLRWALDHKIKALSGPVILVLIGMMVWMGFGKVFFSVKQNRFCNEKYWRRHGNI